MVEILNSIWNAIQMSHEDQYVLHRRNYEFAKLLVETEKD